MSTRAGQGLRLAYLRGASKVAETRSPTGLPTPFKGTMDERRSAKEAIESNKTNLDGSPYKMY